MKLSDVHNCKKCREKIVCISIDLNGVTRCVYCNEVVNYKPYFDYNFKNIRKEMEKKLNE